VKDLNKKRIYVSVGSACQTSKKSSHVLDSMNIKDKKDKVKVIRISLSDYTTYNEVIYLINNLVSLIKKQNKN
jgi:cysteine sulfinate desulfinase/cysteine desulfurase-like protein